MESTELKLTVPPAGIPLQDQLENQVLARTGRRIRNLAIELSAERVVLRGRSTTYHVKQLAQHGVRDILPFISLENAIVVDGPLQSA